MRFHWMKLHVDKVFRGCMEMVLLQAVRLAFKDRSLIDHNLNLISRRQTSILCEVVPWFTIITSTVEPRSLNSADFPLGILNCGQVFESGTTSCSIFIGDWTSRGCRDSKETPRVEFFFFSSKRSTYLLCNQAPVYIR